MEGDHMCEYCGCQALATIEELTREHDLVVNLMGEVRTAHAGADTVRMAELARQIAIVLGPHTEVEEHGLFPALTADFPEHIAALEAEHRCVEAVLADASAGYTGRSGLAGPAHRDAGVVVPAHPQAARLGRPD